MPRYADWIAVAATSACTQIGKGDGPQDLNAAASAARACIPAVASPAAATPARTAASALDRRPTAVACAACGARADKMHARAGNKQESRAAATAPHMCRRQLRERRSVAGLELVSALRETRRI
jgi:hypothetical protein